MPCATRKCPPEEVSRCEFGQHLARLCGIQEIATVTLLTGQPEEGGGQGPAGAEA